MKPTPYPPSHEPDSLGAALRALPGHDAASDGWQRMRAKIEARARQRRLLRTIVPLAMAASVLVALGMNHALRRPAATALVGAQPPTSATPRVTRNNATLAQLQDHSMRLERWLAELRAGGAPLQGPSLASAVNLQDRIGLIDLQLAAPGDAGDRASLWRQRVRLLQDLAMLRASQSPLSGRPVMADNRNPTVHL